jgi:subtilisin family serine protease
MPRWVSVLKSRLLVAAWVVVLGLSGCAPTTVPAPAAVEQAMSEAPGASAVAAASRQQHLEQLGLPRWHDQGYRGQGVKVAILDSGFRGYRSFLGKGLPSSVTTRSFRIDHDLEARDSQHGILCAEVVHALAPEAELLLATWEPDSPRSFLDAVRWSREQGVRVISCSLIMPGWSDGEGGGAIHQALSRLLGRGDSSADLLCFASAGNTAQRHWSGHFHPDAAGRHQWSDGQPQNRVTPWGTERVVVELYGASRVPYELEVIESGSGALVGSARVGADPVHRGQAIVRFEPVAGRAYHICLYGPASAPTDDKFHVVVLGGNPEHASAPGSIAFPGDGAAVYAVGAVDGQRQRIGYSSCGPNSSRPKPDFVATVPFPTQCRERPFAGTSAAAPQAAGLAAVLLSRSPASAPRQVVDALRSAAEDLGPPGHDWETGYGLLRLP